MDFIILSNQQFFSSLKTNKWQVATRLAKLGHRVIFVDPPIRIRKAVKQILTGQSHPVGVFRGYQKVNDNLYVFMPVTLSLTEKPNLNFLNIRRLEKLIKSLDFKDYILWVYHQVMVSYVQKLSYKILIYDCVDEYSKFPNFVRRGLSDYVSKCEEFVAKKADLVFATTESLVQKMKKYNKNVHFTPNVGDYELFKNVGIGKIAVAEKLQELGSARHSGVGSNLPRMTKFTSVTSTSVIGFTGAVDSYKVNLELLEKCALAYPQYNFVLVGPIGLTDKSPNLLKLKSLKNIHFTGEKPYEQMPSFFEGFDVYIIPYNLNDYTVGGCFPVKFHDALSAGLPTVVTALPSYKPFKDVCYIAKDDADFVHLLKKALGENSPQKVKERRLVAQKNSWDVKVSNMLKLIERP